MGWMLKLPELFHLKMYYLKLNKFLGYSTSTYLSLYAGILLPHVSPLSPKDLPQTGLHG